MSDTCELKGFTGGLQIKNESAGEVAAVVATLNVVDKDGDVLLPGSFPPSATVKLSAYGHSAVFGEAPVGLGTITVDGMRAIFRGKYFMSTDRGREAFHTVKELGAAGEWSFGFPRDVTTAPMTDDWRAKNARRLIAKLTPIEASPVFIGAGLHTGTLSAKHLATADPFATHGASVAAIARKMAPAPVTHEDFRRIQRRLESSLVRYRLDTAEPSDAQQKAARYWADQACAVMAVSRVTINWEVGSMKTAGAFRPSEPNSIFLNPFLSLDDIAPTVLHECAHRKRFLCGLAQDEHLVEQDEAELCELLGAS